MNPNDGFIFSSRFFLIVGVWIIAWIAVLTLIAWVSGWRELARHYFSNRPFLGRIWNWQSAMLRWGCSFSFCLTIGSDSSGIYAAVFPVFSFSHPPLFIPWDDVRIRRVKSRWARSGEFWELKFDRVPAIPFRISRKLGEGILKASGREFPPAWV